MMHTHPHLQSLTEALLTHLGREESLLRDSLANLSAVHAALRRGDLPAAENHSGDQQRIADLLREAAALRDAAALALAREAGCAGGVTLSALAAGLPEPLASEIRVARDRLRALTAELAAIHTRNANLIGQLRSYFRGVLASLMPPDTPQRYGRTGGRLGGPAGGALQTHG